jgi:hypothetical protein
MREFTCRKVISLLRLSVMTFHLQLSLRVRSNCPSHVFDFSNGWTFRRTSCSYKRHATNFSVFLNFSFASYGGIFLFDRQTTVTSSVVKQPSAGSAECEERWRAAEAVGASALCVI